MFDFHCHADLLRRSACDSRAVANACVISSSAEQNGSCLNFAQRYGLCCAVFVDPRSESYSSTCATLKDGVALSYQHVERIDFSEHKCMLPALSACRDGLRPIIVHVSSHGRDLVDSAQAACWLDLIVDEADGLPIIVAHAGGENAMEVIRRSKTARNIYFDLSRWEESASRCGFSSVNGFFCSILDAADSTKLLFGSDEYWPSQVDVGDRLCRDLEPLVGEVRLALTKNAIEVNGGKYLGDRV